jgi:hypothetical protein
VNFPVLHAPASDLSHPTACRYHSRPASRQKSRVSGQTLINPQLGSLIQQRADFKGSSLNPHCVRHFSNPIWDNILIAFPILGGIIFVL